LHEIFFASFVDLQWTKKNKRREYKRRCLAALFFFFSFFVKFARTKTSVCLIDTIEREEMADGSTAIVQSNYHGSIPLQCPKLTGTNYTSWSIMVESILQAYGLWEAIDPVTGGAVEAKKNLMARAFVFQTLPEDVLLQVAKHKNAKDVWEALRVWYLGADRVQKARL
jgi:hypothetical protein